jgi:hypothetical protein
MTKKEFKSLVPGDPVQVFFAGTDHIGSVKLIMRTYSQILVVVGPRKIYFMYEDVKCLPKKLRVMM